VNYLSLPVNNDLDLILKIIGINFLAPKYSTILFKAHAAGAGISVLPSL